jgi:alpha-galactosidase
MGKQTERAQTVRTLLITAFFALFCVVNDSLAVILGGLPVSTNPSAILLSEGSLKKTDIQMTRAVPVSDEANAFAYRIAEPLDAEGFPEESAWSKASPVVFNSDWQGRHADPQRQTEVRLLWSPETLFLRFLAHYRTISVFPDAEPSGRRDQLWDRDVVEVFIQPDASEPRRYKEFEISPNGFWIDLDIAAGEKRNLLSNLHRRVSLDEQSHTWTAELAIPMKSISPRAVPENGWKVNFFRCEGAAESRFYSAWRPTHTPKPNFHVPEAFGNLVFAPSPTKGS